MPLVALPMICLQSLVEQVISVALMSILTDQLFLLSNDPAFEIDGKKWLLECMFVDSNRSKAN